MKIDSVGFWIGRRCYMRLNGVDGKVFDTSGVDLQGLGFQFVGLASNKRCIEVLKKGLVVLDFKANGRSYGKAEGFITDVKLLEESDKDKQLHEVTGVLNGHPTN